MKKKIIIYSILAVVAIAAILVITKVFPPVSSEDTSGTIGKVDRYRKVQMTQSDIILRSEFISDTTALAKSIQGLVFFNASIKQYATGLKVCADYLKKNEPSVKQTQAIEDYTKFLDNNINTIEKTIGLLADFYSGDTTDFSIDVESKIKDFSNFASQIASRDSVVILALGELEHNIKFTITSAAKKDEGIKRLKDIHDQMLIKCFQQSVLMGYSLGPRLSERPIYSVQNIGAFQSGQINVYGVKFSKNDLNAILSKDLLGCLNKENLQSYYNKPNLGMGSAYNFGSFINQAKITATIASSGSLNYVFGAKLDVLLFSKNNLGIAAYNSINSFGIAAASFSSSNLQQLIQVTLNSEIANRLDNVLSSSSLGPTTRQAKPLGTL